MNEYYRDISKEQGAPFNILMPLHVRFDTTGHIVSVGPTLAKLRDFDMVGLHMSEVFEITRPKELLNVERIPELEGQRLHLRFSKPPRTPFKGDVTRGYYAFIANLSFGHAVLDAIKIYGLDASDFANTDMAIELLYLLEAKTGMAGQVEALLSQLHVAKSEAEHQAATDQLTGLKNRRALSVSLNDWVADGVTFACMHIDLDYFKSVNDTFGHAAGDAVLENVAGVLRSETRSTDVVARVGGDEFVLLLHNIIDLNQLDGIAQRIISKLEVPVRYEGHVCRISGSAGTAITTQYSVPDPDGLLKDADTALYASKAAGRGCHTFYSKDLPEMAH